MMLKNCEQITSDKTYTKNSKAQERHNKNSSEEKSEKFIKIMSTSSQKVEGIWLVFWGFLIKREK